MMIISGKMYFPTNSLQHQKLDDWNSIQMLNNMEIRSMRVRIMPILYLLIGNYIPTDFTE